MPAEKITKEKIIYAVLECAFTNSLGATSLADIAGKLGIKKASLYNHYSCRDEMIKDTVKFCGDYLKKISLIPGDMAATAQKYSAEVVLKGLVHRWIKLFDKEPLIQIYSLIESEKYFLTECEEIKSSVKEKIASQIEVALQNLAQVNKIKIVHEQEIKMRAEIFCELINSILDNYIFAKKKFIRQNPKTGQGELFDQVISQPLDFKKIDEEVESFCRFLL